MKIFCCDCQDTVDATLTNGKEIYPHRRDLYALPFWICIKCKNYVGCHHKTKTPTQPLGVIPNAQIKAERQKIHALMDPLWTQNLIKRSELYTKIAKAIGQKSYHTANLKTIEESEKVLLAIKEIIASIVPERN